MLPYHGSVAYLFSLLDRCASCAFHGPTAHPLLSLFTVLGDLYGLPLFPACCVSFYGFGGASTGYGLSYGPLFLCLLAPNTGNPNPDLRPLLHPTLYLPLRSRVTSDGPTAYPFYFAAALASLIPCHGPTTYSSVCNPLFLRSDGSNLQFPPFTADLLGLRRLLPASYTLLRVTGLCPTLVESSHGSLLYSMHNWGLPRVTGPSTGYGTLLFA